MNFFNETKTTEEMTGFNTGNVMGDTTFNENMSVVGCSTTPVYECPQERVCHRYINYEVPHIMPMNTRIINHHIYRHTFRPEYTCCEENVCENVFEPKCF